MLKIFCFLNIKRIFVFPLIEPSLICQDRLKIISELKLAQSQHKLEELIASLKLENKQEFYFKDEKIVFGFDRKITIEECLEKMLNLVHEKRKEELRKEFDFFKKEIFTDFIREKTNNLQVPKKYKEDFQKFIKNHAIIPKTTTFNSYLDLCGFYRVVLKVNANFGNFFIQLCLMYKKIEAKCIRISDIVEELENLYKNEKICFYFCILSYLAVFVKFTKGKEFLCEGCFFKFSDLLGKDNSVIVKYFIRIKRCRSKRCQREIFPIFCHYAVNMILIILSEDSTIQKDLNQFLSLLSEYKFSKKELNDILSQYIKNN
ncbi:hypothetical protein EHP00_1078 [Ecytonucleospora hepatopenaei]|uniref:Uncharacterized protein n=1 Tax=Ecytonucleospora hepatopenaei TaxID=646526 RepID=A0A1W0E582_9MICR|nr:hypothetical protein EHP00_1078 [Ecytonucleospora hepatopenaei]